MLIDVEFIQRKVLYQIIPSVPASNKSLFFIYNYLRYVSDSCHL
jgi:hypothetical protein